MIEVGCIAHARRKLHDLYANQRSEVAEEALRYFAARCMKSSAWRESRSSILKVAANCDNSAQSPLPTYSDSG